MKIRNLLFMLLITNVLALTGCETGAEPKVEADAHGNVTVGTIIIKKTPNGKAVIKVLNKWGKPAKHPTKYPEKKTYNKEEMKQMPSTGKSPENNNKFTVAFEDGSCIVRICPSSNTCIFYVIDPHPDAVCPDFK